jgi:cytochrome c-type biogenesis protein CcmH/NrfG
MVNSRMVNFIFTAAVAVLAATALVSAYVNRTRPPILDTPSAMAQGVQLPAGHPPVDAANRIAELEQLSRANPQNAGYKTQLGNAYYDLSQFGNAIEAYEDSLKIRPRDPNVETDLATCYHYAGQSDKALEIIERVLQYAPNFPQALFNKGVVLIERDPRAGIAVWQQLLRQNPEFPQRAEIEQRIQTLQSNGTR